MFLEHFGLIEQPFGVTPDPRFLFLGAKHREALASLLYGTETNRGFLALIAEPGMGKTSLLFHYLESMRPKARSAFLFNNVGDSRALMRHLLTDLGIDSTGKDLAGMHAMLNQVLVEEMNAGRRFILVIDEAQNLDEKVLESVRLLSNFETPWKKLIQIVIAGQPQLAESLARPSMAQLRQRISSVIRLEPFTPEEVNAYISHRLWIAGTFAPVFTVGARLLIAEHSAGIPRNINNLCFNSMSLAFAMGRKQVDSLMVREAIADLELAPANPTRQSATRAFAPERIFTASKAIVLARKNEPRMRRNSWRLVPSMASLCAILLLGLASGAGWRSGLRTPPLDALPLVDTAVLAAPPSSAATSPSSTQPSEKPADASAIASTLAILVERDDTLRHLSLQYLGRFDLQALIEICTLNPAITDPNHIEVGQRIRMPLILHPESAPPGQAATETNALTARGDKP
jgi:type II secretory pathway predicted ATPase ExeA